MALDVKTSTTVDTKKDKDSQSKQTALTVDWTGITEQQLRAGFQAFLIVKLQGSWRAKGIPATYVAMAKDHAPGMRAPSLTLDQQLSALTPEERKALLVKYGVK